jgi:cation diffusion facilitator family transporter
LRNKLSLSDLKKGGVTAQRAFVIIVAVAISEIAVASFSRSVSLLADGVHSISTAAIFLIVWIGLRLSGRSPDGTFHFGYYRIETLGSLIAAFVLAVFGGLIVVESYFAWLGQREIVNAEAAIVVAATSAVIIAVVSWWVERTSEKYGSTALRTGGITGTLDVLSSVAVVVGVVLSRYFGVLHADSIAGILIAGAIFVGAYSIFKEASLVLVDACKCGDVVTAIGDLAKNVKGIKEVHNIRMRRLGPYLVGDLHVVVDNAMLVREADEISAEVTEKIRKEFGKVMEINVIIESDEAHNRHSQKITVTKTEPNSKTGNSK